MQNKQKDISIITVVLNQKFQIEETIKSVLTQSDVEIEYIIIDGGSTDGTLDILNKYSNQLSILISEKDNGIFYAINKGLNYASAPLVGILHSGDTYEPGILKIITTEFKYSNADVIYGDVYFKENIGNEFIVRSAKADHKKLRDRMTIFHPSTFVKSDIYHKYGTYNTIYLSAADYEFFLRLFFKLVTYKYIPLVLATYRTGGYSSKNYMLSIRENYEIKKYHIGKSSAFRNYIITLIRNYYFQTRKKILLIIFGEKILNSLKLKYYYLSQK